MADESGAPVVITLRDVYNSVQDLKGTVSSRFDEVEDWQHQHQVRDTEMFGSLNVKFYGILAGLSTVLVAVVAAFIK